MGTQREACPRGPGLGAGRPGAPGGGGTPVSPGPGGPSSTTSMISSSPWKSNAPGPSAGSMPACPRATPRRHSHHFRRSAPPRPIPTRVFIYAPPLPPARREVSAPRGALWEMQFFIPSLRRHPPAAPARRTTPPGMQRGRGSPARPSMAAALGGLRGKGGQGAGSGSGVPRRDSPRPTVPYRPQSLGYIRRTRAAPEATSISAKLRPLPVDPAHLLGSPPGLGRGRGWSWGRGRVGAAGSSLAPLPESSLPTGFLAAAGRGAQGRQSCHRPAGPPVPPRPREPAGQLPEGVEYIPTRKKGKNPMKPVGVAW